MNTKITPNPSIRGGLVDFISNIKVIQQEGLKTAIIDADSILFAVCVDKKQDENQIAQYGDQTERTLEQVIDEFNTYFLKVLMDSGCIQYVAFLTNGSHRYSFYPEYKANRKKLDKPKYLSELREYTINTLGFCQVKGYEADDLVNMCRQQLGENTLIVHTDKDLDQITGNHYNYKKPEFYNIDLIESDSNLWKQVLQGDFTDGIPGCKGIGISKANLCLHNADLKGDSYPGAALNKYIEVYKNTTKAIEEFSLTYKLIKLLDLGDSGLFFQPSNIEDKLDLEFNLNI